MDWFFPHGLDSCPIQLLMAQILKRLPTLYALLQSLDRRAHAGQEHVVPLDLLVEFLHLVECHKGRLGDMGHVSSKTIWNLWIDHWMIVDCWINVYQQCISNVPAMYQQCISNVSAMSIITWYKLINITGSCQHCSWSKHTFKGEESASFRSRTSSQSKFSFGYAQSPWKTLSDLSTTKLAAVSLLIGTYMIYISYIMTIHSHTHMWYPVIMSVSGTYYIHLQVYIYIYIYILNSCFFIVSW